MISRLFARKPRRTLARELYQSAASQARARRLYAEMNAPDTPEGRFEILTLHVILLTDRLRERGEADLSQSVFDCYLSDLDGALREMGVGDLSVGRRMRKLGEAFYGRAAAYRRVFADGSHRDQLQALIARTVLEGRADARALAQYVVDCRTHLAGLDPTEGPADLWPPC